MIKRLRGLKNTKQPKNLKKFLEQILKKNANRKGGK